MGTYKINKKFVIQKLDNKTVIFDADNFLLFTLNETSSFILKLLKRKLQEGEIIEKIVGTYKVEFERAKKDVRESIADLEKKKIIGK